MDLPQALRAGQLPRRSEAPCPHARLGDDAEGRQYVVCGVMERDQMRADSITEGAPVGVVIRAHENPSTFYFFCTGTGAPGSPDDDPPPEHYTGCPVHAAEREWKEGQRLYGVPEIAEPDEEVREWAERGVLRAGEETLEEPELRWLEGAAP